jgi:hypothetical protein
VFSLKYRKIGFSLLIVFFVVVISLYFMGAGQTTVNEINKYLNIAEIKLGMNEDQVIQLWGTGDYRGGFGGHGREYKDKKVFLGFAGDKDNDLYGSVSTIDVSNPIFSVFGIRIGDPMLKASDKIKKYGFRFNNQIYIKDEFAVAIRGEHEVELIQIWFNDKDLKDRQY